LDENPKSIPLLQKLTGSHSPVGDDVHKISSFGYKRRFQPPFNNVSLRGLVQTLKGQNPQRQYSLPVIGA